MKPVETLLECLSGSTCNGSGYKALCPAHDDHEPSLSIWEGDDKRAFVKCFAGCSKEEIVAALGLSMSDLYARPEPNSNGRPKRKIVATYDYLDADGELLHQTVRFEPKGFSQRRPKPSGKRRNEVGDDWIWSFEGIEPVLYRLPEVLRAVETGSAVYLCEGEKDADRLAGSGLTATTNANGAEKWRESYSEVLRGANVVILADNDTAGRKHVERVARSLKGKAASVRVLQLPGLPHKGDVSDYLDAGGAVEELERLAREEPEWEPASDSFNSSVPREGVADESNLKFKTAKEVAEETPAETEWIAKPWVAKGAITEVDGKIKAGGKTTWVTHMVRKTLDGEPFMGEPTTKTKVVYLTEQSSPSFRKALERADLLEREDMLILPWHDTRGVGWPHVVRAAINKAKEVGASVLFVDTLGQFAGIRGDAENSAGAAHEAMKPLQEAAAEGLAVVLTRHERKGGGEVGESGRGSSAFGGAVDIILSIRKGEGNMRPTVRVIESLSRFDETPDKRIIELTEGGYKALGDATDFAEKEATRAVMELLPSEEEKAMTTARVVDKLDAQDIKRTMATATLTKLSEAGTVQRIGEGKKGNPYRYYKPGPDEGRGEAGEEFFNHPAVSGRTNPPGSSEDPESQNPRTTSQIHSSGTPTLEADERKGESATLASLAQTGDGAEASETGNDDEEWL